MNHDGGKSLRSNRLHIVLLLLILGTAVSDAQLAGTPGAFARMGFGARGMGLGNAMTAVRTGENSGFYNPAAVAQLKNQHASIAYSTLSLDRSLNSLFFSSPIDTNAGIAFGVLNSGVSDIDGRDNDGFKTETYSISENQFFLSFALRIRKMTIGLTTKMYYFSLFEKLNSTAVGFDAGFILPLSQNLNPCCRCEGPERTLPLGNIQSTGRFGNSTIDKRPTRQVVGLSYQFNDLGALVSAEYEHSNKGTDLIRIGGEISPIEMLTLRAGVDGWDLSTPDMAHPSFGFTLRTDYSEWKPSLNYAYVLEPYGLFTIHVISISVSL